MMPADGGAGGWGWPFQAASLAQVVQTQVMTWLQVYLWDFAREWIEWLLQWPMALAQLLDHYLNALMSLMMFKPPFMSGQPEEGGEALDDTDLPDVTYKEFLQFFGTWIILLAATTSLLISGSRMWRILRSKKKLA